MKKLITLVALLWGLSAQATPMLINDGYIGADAHGHGDVIGNNAKFNISSMEVDLVGNTLTVLINTGFVNNGGLGSFSNYTRDPATHVKDGNGIGFGDLFLSSTGWNPYGSAPYAGDDNTNGTLWDFAINLDDRWDTGSGATLYQLTGASNLANAYLSDDFLVGATYRNGQEVAVKTANNLALNNQASFDATVANQILFSVDVSGTRLATADRIGFHWGMTCANDTIEGEYVSAPEPSTLALMLMSVLMLGFSFKVRAQTANNRI